jgi:hypothetical protein
MAQSYNCPAQPYPCKERRSPMFNYRLAFGLLIVLLLLWLSTLARTTVLAHRALLPSQQTISLQVTEITLATRDLIYDPTRDKIYASVPSTAGTNGNSIVAISVPTGTIGGPIFVGSEPNKLARSADGHYLYVGLDGAGAIRRVNLISQTAEIQFALGSDSCGLYLAEDMVVLNDHANAVAVARRNTGCSPRHEGVAIYDDGVQRFTKTGDHTGSNSIEGGDAADVLYGYNNETTEFGFRIMTISAAGVTISATKQGLYYGFGITLHFSDGLLYGTNGTVVDPATQTIVGSYAASGLVYPDPSAGRVYFINTFGQPELKIFDQTKFTLITTISLAGVTGTPSSLIKAGENRLAFRTSTGKLYLLQLSEANSTPTPIPSPTPSPTLIATMPPTTTVTATPSVIATTTATATPPPTPPPTIATPSELVDMAVSEISLTTQDLLYDPIHDLIFASLPSSTGSNGNSIVTIAPTTGAVGSPIFVGSEPNKLAISANGQFLYIGLDGAGAVRRFNIASQMAEIQFALGSDVCGIYQAEDMVVLKDNPNAVAVSHRSGCIPHHKGIAIYDNGIQRSTTSSYLNMSNVIESANNAAVLYGHNNETAAHDFHIFALTAQGITLSSTTRGLISGFGHDIRSADGLIYATSGAVLNPNTKTLVGTYGTSGLVYPDPASGRVYFLNMSGQPQLQVFHLANFTPLNSFPIMGVAGTPSSLIKVGPNRLAFRTNAKELFFLTLLEATATPTTEPSATPTATAVLMEPTPTLPPDPTDIQDHVVHLPLVNR